MFGMSVVEIGIILVLALVLLGPDELPKVAKTVGKALRELRKTTDDLKSTFEQEMVRLDEDPPVSPMLVPPPLDPGGEPSAGALDQLRDPGAARAAARMLGQPNDPGAARAAARLAAAGLAPAPASSGANGSGADQTALASAASAAAGPAGAPEAPLAGVAAPATTPLSDTATGASATESAHALADATVPAHAAPPPRTPPADTVPREKKSGPAA